jgi:hypothetical protein
MPPKELSNTHLCACLLSLSSRDTLVSPQTSRSLSRALSLSLSLALAGMGVAGNRDDVQIPGGLVTDPVTRTSQNLQLIAKKLY